VEADPRSIARRRMSTQQQDAPALVASIRSLVTSLPGATGIGAAAVFTNGHGAAACGARPPRGRVQQVLELASDFSTAKLVTWDRTRKVNELAADPSITLFWHNTGGDMGWVSASGTAQLEDATLTDKAGKSYGGVHLVVTIDRLECLNYSPEIMADPNGEGWIPVALVRTPSPGPADSDDSHSRHTWRVQKLEDYGYDSSLASPVRSTKGVVPVEPDPE
jgi:hypothetical protein